MLHKYTSVASAPPSRAEKRACERPESSFGAGLFFLVGPYAAIQYFMAECYPVSCRATGTAFIGAMSQPGIVIGGALFTAVAAGANTGTAALWVGALGILISGVLMFAAKPMAEAPLAVAPETELKAQRA